MRGTAPAALPRVLTRSALPPRSNRVVTIGIVATCAIATAVATKIALTPSARQEPTIARPAAKPATSAIIPITTPQPIVVHAPPPPPPKVALVELPPPPPRATTPVIRAACVTSDPETQSHASCTWDSGFPAISADGSTIAAAYIPVDNGRGHPGLSIRFIDATTGKRVKDMLVLSPHEYVDRTAGEEAERKHQALQQKVDRRAASAQRLLDEGAYRSLVRLGSRGTASELVQAAGLEAEYDMDAARIIDLASNTVLWQRRFAVGELFPNRELDGERCQPIGVGDVALSWDPQTRTVLAEVAFAHGPEFCGESKHDYVQRVRG